ncbi:Aluminum-activated malate transporter 12 [Cinnamomum micranthum f. kanehirae]|uniref:Aluminum-activated malate transporter 12 n=1 Tax=Cinnamomum micranthum f. kanehirae TaxID=337451 RepID=A0A443NQ10_9MAGN|nr:Aluminum-activated malate transporter 12 [Cinnamomum micranthum f. kanehirae]
MNMNVNMNMNKMSSGGVVVELGSDSPMAHNEMTSSNDTSKVAGEKTTMKRWVVSSSSSREGGGSQPKRKMLERMKKWTVRMHQMVCKVGKDDPRRVVHSIKVGLSLTLLSLIYLLEPLFQGIGQNAIWAVLFVILIFEFTAGATLYKGLSQGIGTLSALFLAFIVKVISQSMGRTGYAVFIGFSVFVIGMLTTYIRFFPSIKKYYDQGVLVFFATYNLITVSGYRDQNMLHMVFQRLYVIAIGFGLCIIMSILILPNWSGKDLQNSIISKIEALAKSINEFLILTACVNEYFQEPDKKVKSSYPSKDIDGGYEAALEWKSADEALETFASLEPRHSRYCYPWQQYVQLGKILRHLGYTAISLHGCLESQIQTPRSVRALFRQPCQHVAEEVAKVLTELADSIRKHCHCSPHIADELHGALQDLDIAIKSQPRLFLCSKPATVPRTDTLDLLAWRSKRQVDLSKDSNRKSLHRTLSNIAITSLEFSEALPFAAFTSLLVEMALRLELVIEEVEELGRIANFKEYHEECEIKMNVVSEKTESPDAHELQTSHTLSEEELRR